MKNVLFAWRNLILVVFLATSSIVSAAEFHVSDSCKISLLTCSPGNELYSCFGHSGIRVNDPLERVDIVFNYGTFDFERPGFYVNFCRGILIYSLGVDQYFDFENQYIYEQRGLSEQILNLTTEEKQAIVEFLLTNAQRENRDYRYDFLLDNCATRIRDVFEKHLGGKLAFHTEKWDTIKTFRYLIDEYSWFKRWESFGMNLLIGLPVDKPTTPRQQMFLPNYLRDGFTTATVNGNEPFVTATREILPAPNFDKSANWTSPEWLFAIILGLLMLLTFAEIRFNFHVKVVDFILLFTTGLLGLLFLTLWLFTQHWTTAWNLNLLWALPTHLLLAFAILFNGLYPKLKQFFFIALILEIAFLTLHFVLPQPFQIGMILINAMLVTRLFRLYWKAKSLE